jgi:hypothetical protein
VKLAFTDTVAGRFPSLESFRVLAADPLFGRALAGTSCFRSARSRSSS